MVVAQTRKGVAGANIPKKECMGAKPSTLKKWVVLKGVAGATAQTAVEFGNLSNRGNPNPKGSGVVRKTNPKRSGAKTKILKEVAACEKATTP